MEYLAKLWGWDKKQFEENMTSLRFFWKDANERGWLNCQGWRFQLSDPQGMEISNQVLVQMLLWWDSLPEDAVALPNFEALQHKVGDRELMVDYMVVALG